jgi:hypothetical protein
MQRRRFVRTIATGGASVFAIGNVGAGSPDEDAGANASERAGDGDGSVPVEPIPGYVSTRGHFWVGSGNDFLADGRDETGYEIEGTIPGYSGVSPDELVVVVHGFTHTETTANTVFGRAAAGLDAAGYDGQVVGFSWDADGPSYQWWPIDDVATRNGPKLGLFLLDYANMAPDTTVRVVGHSLGTRVVLEAMQALHDWGFEGTIDSVTLLGAAVSDRSIAIGESWLDVPYGPALDAQVDRVDNFWKSTDEVLNSYFEWAEWDAALGSHGTAGSPPGDYADQRVDHVDGHTTYYEHDAGCTEAVVDEW